MGKTAEHFSDWLAVCSVSYFKWLSQSVAGDDTFDASSNLSCYIDETLRPITNFMNEEIVSDAQLFINGSNALVSGITSKDKFVLDEEDRYPQKIRKYRDEMGTIDYVVVFL